MFASKVAKAACTEYARNAIEWRPLQADPSFREVCLRPCDTEWIPAAHTAGSFGGHGITDAFFGSEFQFFTTVTTKSLLQFHVRS